MLFRSFKEFKKNKLDVLQFLHTEIIDTEEKKVLVIMRKDFDVDELKPKFFEVIEKEISVTSDGELKPNVIDFVKIESPY